VFFLSLPFLRTPFFLLLAIFNTPGVFERRRLCSGKRYMACPAEKSFAKADIYRSIFPSARVKLNWMGTMISNGEEGEAVTLKLSFAEGLSGPVSAENASPIVQAFRKTFRPSTVWASAIFCADQPCPQRASQRK